MTLTEIRNKVEKAWVRESSYKPENWTFRNPAFGQCAVTALLIHELLGGECAYGKFYYSPEHNYRLHYWNIVNGFTIDFTLIQFDVKKSHFQMIGIIEPEKLITDDWMRERYQIFKQNFDELRSSKR